MTRRLNHEARNHDDLVRRGATNIKDEHEYREHDAAARWLERRAGTCDAEIRVWRDRAPGPAPRYGFSIRRVGGTVRTSAPLYNSKAAAHSAARRLMDGGDLG